ncbi:ST8SIA1 [Branchiostoma lanceolatum]|uniref:ST8SIA1 protein n=2 Tax=Branchiostoma lanceolatum TaxID=7740 RepID=A0A8K0EFU8_BRALA|nr:ST8SIA1 [Branchiostoma lanceolatum]
MNRRAILFVLALTVSISLNVVLIRRVMMQDDMRLAELLHNREQHGGSGLSERTAVWREPSRRIQNNSKDDTVTPPGIGEGIRGAVKNSNHGSETENNVTTSNGTSLTHNPLPPEAVSIVHPQAPWTFNVTAADQFRVEAEEATKTQNLFVMTQKNVKLNSSLKYQAEKRYFNITKDLYSWLPRDQPFGFRKYKTCSVVGNGGILVNSGCGTEIDSADFVIRMNLPQMRNYTVDVGKKTNLVSANPTILRHRFNSLRSKANQEAFLNYTRHYQDAYLYFSAFTYRFCAKLSFSAYKAVQNAKGKTTNATVIFGHPQHLDLATKFWKGKYNIKEKRLTSGLYFVGASMSMCEETRLYGFWPLYRDRQGRVLTHHYYDNVTMSALHQRVRHHSMPEEFAVLRGLHDRGVLQMTTDRCSS